MKDGILIPFQLVRIINERYPYLGNSFAPQVFCQLVIGTVTVCGWSVWLRVKIWMKLVFTFRNKRLDDIEGFSIRIFIVTMEWTREYEGNKRALVISAQ
ncbi:hypothetical protein QRE66_16710 [Bacillus cereus]|nr:hypothetical protein QRE66_16710 [Bacillus cereus]